MVIKLTRVLFLIHCKSMVVWPLIGSSHKVLADKGCNPSSN